MSESMRWGQAARLVRVLGVSVCTAASALAMAGCTSPPSSGAPSAFPSGTGVVIGGIEACHDLSAPPTDPQFVPGTVDVFRGDRVTPHEATLATEVVATGGIYSFLLAAGRYVVVANAPTVGFSQLPSATITVSAGQVTMQDLQYYGCI
jgi:hypothetical protein